MKPAAVMPLFSSLSPEGVRRMLSTARMLSLKDAEVLFREGDTGDALYVILSGSMKVVSEAKEGGNRVELARLGEGEFFGEIALFADRPRQATLESAGETRLLEINRQNVYALAQHEPGLLHVLFQFFRERIVSLLVKNHPLFRRFEAQDLEELIQSFLIYDVEEGTTLIQQGQPSPAFVIIVDGELAVERAEHNAILPVAKLEPGAVCGEISLIDGRPAVASVRATRKSVVLAMARDVFDKTTRTHPELYNYIVEVGRSRLKELNEISARVGLI